MVSRMRSRSGVCNIHRQSARRCRRRQTNSQTYLPSFTELVIIVIIIATHQTVPVVVRQDDRIEDITFSYLQGMREVLSLFQFNADELVPFHVAIVNDIK